MEELNSKPKLKAYLESLRTSKEFYDYLNTIKERRIVSQDLNVMKKSIQKSGMMSEAL
jgi:hypothetical protein